MFAVDAGNVDSTAQKSSLNLIKLVADEHFESNDRQLVQPTELCVCLFQSTTHL